MGDSSSVRVHIRVFAIVTVAVLVLVVFETTVANASGESVAQSWPIESEATVSPPAEAAYVNETRSDDSPDPVPPGEVIQAWDNSSFSPQSVGQGFPVKLIETSEQVTYYAPYGEFVLDRLTPYFVRVRHYGAADEETWTAFVVKYDGGWLVPREGSIDATTQLSLRFHYDAFARGKRMGTVNVTYLFLAETNKITGSFLPGAGTDPALSQLVWLSFTTYRFLKTRSDSEKDVSAIDLAPVDLGEARAFMKPVRGESRAKLLDFRIRAEGCRQSPVR